ncbi:MAG: cupredoxin domain-containing protein [Thermosynechococcaceae cyanobacterium]
MLLKFKFLNHLLGLGLLVGVLTGVAIAQPTEPRPEQGNPLRRIEQPLLLKVGVTLGGIALIGAELWWFQFRKTKAQQAEVNKGFQEIDIIVDGGYEPSQIGVQAGQPVRLNFLRKDPSRCLETVLLPDFHKAVDLPLDQTTTVEFTPQEPGNFVFRCGMNMFRGTLKVYHQEEKIPSENSLENG